MKTFTFSTWIKLTFWLILLIIQLCTVHAQYSQQWVATVNGYTAKPDLLKDASGNFYTFAGSILAKFNSSGSSVFAVNTVDHIKAISMDAAGNIFLTGGRYNAPSTSVYVKKYSSNGVEMFNKTNNARYNSVYSPVNIAVDNNSNIFVYSAYYVNGTYHSNSSKLLFFDNNGNYVNEISASGNGTGKMLPDNSGNVFVSGYTYSYYGNYPVYSIVSKYNWNGNMLFYGTIDSGVVADITFDNSGNLYAAGRVTTKFSAAGTKQWEVVNGFYASSIKVSANGNIFVTGAQNSGNLSNVITTRLNSNGQTMWSQVFDGSANGLDAPADLQIMQDGNIMVCGKTEILAGNFGMFLFKYSQSGSLMHTNFYTSSGDDQALLIRQANLNDAVVYGSSGSEMKLIKYADVTAIVTTNNQLPDSFILSQNYPNPFNPNTKISFSIPKASFVRLTVYDISGKEVEVLVNENLKAGSFEADFNASGLTSGVYFCRIQAGEFTDVKKMILVK